MALAALALHPQRVVAGGAVDDPAQQVEALLLSASAVAAVAGAARLHLHLHALEVPLGYQRLVAPLGFDPLFGVAPDERAFALLDAAEVEPVPEEPARVDGVFEHRADRRLRPLARGVPLGVDVPRRWRATGPVQVVGDLRVAGAGEEALEHLGDHRRLFGVGNEPRLGVAGSCPRRVGMRLVAEAVSVGRAAAVAVALAGVLGLPAADLAAELLDLELVERLEHVADQPSLRARLIAGRQGVEDLDPGAGHLPLVGERMEEVAAEPRGRIDDHRVKARSVPLLRLADQLAPADPVVAAASLLIGELADDPPAQLGDFGLALVPLRGEGERRVLLVLGRETAVPGEFAHQVLLPSLDFSAAHRRRVESHVPLGTSPLKIGSTSAAASL